MRKYRCHRCGGSDNEHHEWVEDIKISECYYYDNGKCGARIIPAAQCDATRYVRADVAMRYARMRERKYKSAAILRGYWDDEMQKEAEVEEAQQAAQRQYHIEKCHTCNRIKTACVCDTGIANMKMGDLQRGKDKQ